MCQYHYLIRQLILNIYLRLIKHTLTKVFNSDKNTQHVEQIQMKAVVKHICIYLNYRKFPLWWSTTKATCINDSKSIEMHYNC
jgi:hypothetical protein